MFGGVSELHCSSDASVRSVHRTKLEMHILHIR